MKAIKIIIISLTIILIIFSAITFGLLSINPFLPIFKTTDGNGINVFIDGVKYKQLPYLKWDIYPSGKRIGYAGSWDTSVSEALDDTDRNFIFLHGIGASMYDGIFYRTDKEIPEPSAESINTVKWVEYYIVEGEGKEINKYTNTIVDKEIIKKLLSAKNSDDKTNSSNIFKKNNLIHIIYINCTSSSITGASYRLNLAIKDNKIVFGSSDKRFIEIPSDFVEKIAGKKMNVEELQTELQQ